MHDVTNMAPLKLDVDASIHLEAMVDVSSESDSDVVSFHLDHGLLGNADGGIVSTMAQEPNTGLFFYDPSNEYIPFLDVGRPFIFHREALPLYDDYNDPPDLWPNCVDKFLDELSDDDLIGRSTDLNMINKIVQAQLSMEDLKCMKPCFGFCPLEVLKPTFVTLHSMRQHTLDTPYNDTSNHDSRN